MYMTVNLTIDYNTEHDFLNRLEEYGIEIISVEVDDEINGGNPGFCLRIKNLTQMIALGHLCFDDDTYHFMSIVHS